MILERLTVEQKRRLMEAARGEIPADLVITGGSLVNVHTREIHRADIAVKATRIVAVGDVSHAIDRTTRQIDAQGKYLCPGLIETHMHVSASHLSMTQLAKVMIAHGTTAVSTDFLHVGMVSGLDGIRFCLQEAKRTPLKILFVVPTAAYFQNRQLGLEATPKAPSGTELMDMLHWPECVGIGETSYGSLKDDNVLLNLFLTALSEGKVVTGTGTGAGDRNLSAYLIAGASSDHEMTTAEEAVSKARLGMRIHIREGNAMSNLAEIVKAITKHGVEARHFIFCADEEDPDRLARLGDIDLKVRLAIQEGIDPITAVQIATLNAAEYFRVDDDIGSISPGKIADILLIGDLDKFTVSSVFANGRLVAQDGRFIGEIEVPKYPDCVLNTIRLLRPIRPGDFDIPAPAGREEVTVRAIGAKEGSVISDERIETLKVKNRGVQVDIEKDILKIAMIERHRASGKIGTGFVQGFKLREGAIAESFSPMEQDLLVVGANNEDMSFAINELVKVGGGQIVVSNCKVLEMLPLPILGLMSDRPAEEVVAKSERMLSIIRSLGCELRSPFGTLAFMSVSALGRIKISDQGLYDVDELKVVPTVLDYNRANEHDFGIR